MNVTTPEVFVGTNGLSVPNPNLATDSSESAHVASTTNEGVDLLLDYAQFLKEHDILAAALYTVRQLQTKLTDKKGVELAKGDFSQPPVDLADQLTRYSDCFTGVNYEERMRKIAHVACLLHADLHLIDSKRVIQTDPRGHDLRDSRARVYVEETGLASSIFKLNRGNKKGHHTNGVVGRLKRVDLMDFKHGGSMVIRTAGLFKTNYVVESLINREQGYAPNVEITFL